ncbi:patatin-like phospholipase family protein [Propioniciclava coleopterorum]|uniref:patatin-like phospholipase family protein n=1 Tax=Propioniciclava coleopterorum TaxID=2714937 RepID=UPI00198241C9|nr:patatin-like phospholipase family protein [Propioniciclava coleopterorum]
MRIALSLGSGGARGYAHIGVIQELRARDHEIVAIAGTSMGALVGGLEAAGRLDAYSEWVTTLNQRDVLMLLDPAFTGPGVFWGSASWGGSPTSWAARRSRTSPSRSPPWPPT